MTHLSKIISLLLHPLFMPVIVCFFCLCFVQELNFVFAHKELVVIFSTLIVATILLPLIVLLLLLKNNSISSLKMNTKEERVLPLFFTSICILLAYFLLKTTFFYLPVLNLILLGAVLAAVFSAIISKFWKISLHMLGIGGGVGVFMGLHYLFGGILNIILLFLFLSGLLGAARIKEKAHDHPQIYIGFLTGFVTEFLLIIDIKSL